MRCSQTPEFVLRASDLLNLRWVDLLDKEELIIKEEKTGKIRHVSINDSLKEILKYSSDQLIRKGKFSVENTYSLTGILKKHPYSINRLLLKTFNEFGIKSANASTHTLRKTFGKRVWEMDGKSERSLIYLSQIFNVFTQIFAPSPDILLSMKTGAVLERGKGRDYYDFIFLSGLTDPDFGYLDMKFGITHHDQLYERILDDFEKLVFDPEETRKVLLFKEYIRQKLDQSAR